MLVQSLAILILRQCQLNDEKKFDSYSYLFRIEDSYFTFVANTNSFVILDLTLSIITASPYQITAFCRSLKESEHISRISRYYLILLKYYNALDNIKGHKVFSPQKYVYLFSFCYKSEMW